MSIWSSFFTLGKIRNGNYPKYSGDEWTINDEPYADFTAADGYYTTADTLDSTPRAGFVDLAESWAELPLIRLCVTEIDNGQEREAEVYLSDDQVLAMYHALGDVIMRRIAIRSGKPGIDPATKPPAVPGPLGIEIPPETRAYLDRGVDEDDGPPISYQSLSELDEVAQPDREDDH